MAEYSKMRAFNGMNYGLDPKTNQWRQLYLDQSNESPDFSNAYTFNNTGVPLNEGQGWNDPLGLGGAMEKYALPATLGVMGGAGMMGLFGGAGAAAGSSFVGDLPLAAEAGGVGDAAIAGGAGESALSGTGEPGMWDWLDQMDTGGGYDPGASSAYNAPTGPYNLGGGLTVDEYGNTSGGLFRGGPGTPGAGDFGSSSLGSILKQYGAQGLAALKGLSSGAGGTSPSHGGSALSGFLGNPAETAFNSAPFLLALAESNRQSGDLNGVINKINGQGYTDSVLHPYDMETGTGRSNMLQDMSLRGVSGSSFGNQQVGNYDYMRALGRGDLASKAGLASAGLEGSLINQRNTNRNMLLGAGLNASARLFSPQPDPFGLRALGL